MSVKNGLEPEETAFDPWLVHGRKNFDKRPAVFPGTLPETLIGRDPLPGKPTKKILQEPLRFATTSGRPRVPLLRGH